MEKKKISVVTGTRAEYNILYPLMDSIRNNSAFDLSTIVTGMHLLHEFGYTIKDVQNDGFKIDATVDMLLSEDSLVSMAKSLGIGIMGIAQAFQTINPDFVIVCGDRGEAFAAAVAAAHMQIPVIHLLGGDAAAGSNIDDSIRFAITKFAHIHLTATKKHAERILKLGEEPWRVHVVGSPALDTISHIKFPSRVSIARNFGLKADEPIAIVIQHPTSIGFAESSKEMKETLDAICELNLQSVIIYPNADAGGKSMIDEIKKYSNLPYIKSFSSLSRDLFLSLMSIADVMIGNSSSGLIEAPSFKLPVVNVGIRQDGRDRGSNVIDVDYNKHEIITAINKALCNDFRKNLNSVNPYGDGKATERIIDVLIKTQTTPDLLRKKITY